MKVFLPALLLALALPSSAEDHDHHHSSGAQQQPSSPGMSDEEFDQGIQQWRREVLASTEYHEKQKPRILKEIGQVHDQYHHNTEKFDDSDPRSLITPKDFGQLKDVVDKDAKLEAYIWQVGKKHGLDPMNNKEQVKQIMALVNAAYDNPEEALKQGKAANFKLAPDERQKLMELSGGYVNSMHALGGASPGAAQLHDAWHQIATKVDPQNGGVGNLPPGMQQQHNDNFVKDQPKDPYPLVFGGNQDLLNGDAASAASKAQQALGLDPNNVQALDLAGAANYQMKNNAAAAAAAQKALALDPKDETAQAILNFTGKTGIGSGPNLKGASDAFGNGKAEDAPQGGVLGFSRGLNGALLASVDKEAPQTAMLLRDAMAALNVGDAAGAVDALNKALAADPGNIRALNARAMALARQRRYGEALADAEAVLAKDPKNQLAMDTRALALNKLKRFQEAAAQARLAIEANPNDAQAWRQLAEALAGLGDRSGSLAALKKAAELDARFQPTLDAALQLPADADLNLLFADDGPSAAAVGLARGGVGSSGRPLNWSFISAAAAAGLALLAVGFWPILSRKLDDAWRKMTKHQVVRASEVRYVVDLVLKGQYRVGDELGGGVPTTVHEGFDEGLQRKVAIKRTGEALRADPKERARFLQEAKAAAALKHPNIAQLYAVAEEGDEAFRVQELVRGMTLADFVQSKGRLRLEDALPILRAIVAGLDHIHARGMLHRDLKPSNILIGEDGSIKLTDFGIQPSARPYMAPELEQGQPRKESDVYALGLCLYEMLTGRAAFAGTGAGMLMSKMSRAYAPVTTLAPELPGELDAVFAAALEPDPGKRTGSARELLTAFESATAGRRG